MRVALAAVLLASPTVALADYQGTASTAVRPPTPDSTLANPNGYNVIAPTGNATTDYANLSAAFAGSASRSVMLTPGFFRICQPGLEIPEKGVVKGSGEVSGWNDVAQNYGDGRVVISCSTTGSFAGGDAFIIMHSRSKLSNIAIHGLADLNPGLTTDCINIKNVVGPIIEDNDIQKCYNGINVSSDHNVTGPDGWGYSQVAVIRNNFIAGNQNIGIYGASTNGGFIADMVVSGNNLMFNQAKQISLSGAFTNAITNNRIEDGIMGIELINSYTNQVTGNMMDRLVPGISINGGGYSLIANNEAHGYSALEGGPFCCGIIFAGDPAALVVGPNNFVGWLANYGVASGSVSGQFFGNESYSDAATEAAILPYLQTTKPPGFSSLVLTGSTFAAPNFAAFPNIRLSLLASACPCAIPNPSSTPDGVTGTISIAQDAFVADTVTWGSAFAGVIPTLSTTPGDIDLVPYTISSNRVILHAKTTAAVGPNVLAGGNGMTSGWTVGGAGLTFNVGTDPNSTSTAASLKEDASTGSHAAGQSIPAQELTCSIYIHAGTSGTRNFKMEMWYDTSHDAWARFSQAGAILDSGAGASSSVSLLTPASVGGGWSRVGFTGNIGAAPSATLYLVLDNGSDSYSGDNTSNVWLWGPNCH